MPRRPDRRPHLRSPEPLAGVLGRAERQTAARGKPTIPRSDWEAAVGARIAERAEPVELDRGTLLVRVATSVWAQELSLLTTPILERLRARGLAVSAIRYRVGSIEAPAHTTALRESFVVPQPLPLPPDMVGALAAVGDPDLRTAIGDAARANLAWQSYVAPRISRGGSRAARVPRSAERESGPPDRTTEAAPGASRRKP